MGEALLPTDWMLMESGGDYSMNLTRKIRLCLMLLLPVLPVVVQAQFTFTTNNGAITITGYTGSGGSVVIPDTINGYPVTGIGSFVFSGISGVSLTNVTIGTNVTDIGQGAFSGCTGLTSITIPNSVASIGNEAFADCSSLTNVTIGNHVASIGDSAFFTCTNLISITIPNSVTNIGGGVFADCSRLTSITVDCAKFLLQQCQWNFIQQVSNHPHRSSGQHRRKLHNPQDCRQHRNRGVFRLLQADQHYDCEHSQQHRKRSVCRL